MPGLSLLCTQVTSAQQQGHYDIIMQSPCCGPLLACTNTLNLLAANGKAAQQCYCCCSSALERKLSVTLHTHNYQPALCIFLTLHSLLLRARPTASLGFVKARHKTVDQSTFLRLQCYASSAKSQGTLPGTALTLPSIRAPKSACAVAKANVQLLGWRTTIGDTASSQTLARPRPYQLFCSLPSLTFCWRCNAESQPVVCQCLAPNRYSASGMCCHNLCSHEFRLSSLYCLALSTDFGPP